MIAPFIIDGISKTFGPTQILKNISLEYTPGSITTLLGANGAGKSTLLRCCVGLLTPDAGSCGIRLSNSSALKLPQNIGFVSHHAMLYGSLSVEENLNFFASLCAEEIDLKTEIQIWELEALINTSVNKLSKGQLMRASLCRAFMGSPQYIFLDEPSAPLDQRSVDLLLSAVRSAQQRGSVVVIATHDIHRIVCQTNRAVLVHEGAIVDQVQINSGTRVEDIMSSALIARYVEGQR